MRNISLVLLFFMAIMTVFLFAYKRSWFLKLHLHNILGGLYDIKVRMRGACKEFDLPDDIKKANAAKPLELRSYINDTQNVHPKVLYFEKGFGGHKYWMAYTPFPWYIDRYENPCIAFSDDGYSWTNIVENPIDDPKGNGYDSDVHLVFRENDNVLECWYRHVGNYSKPPVEEVLHRRVTKDGIHWSEDEEISGNYSGQYAMFLSPAILWDGEKYLIWTVNKERDYRIEYRTYTDGGKLEKIREFDLDFSVDWEKTRYKPWHLDVIQDNGKYIMLVMCKEEKGTGPRRWDTFITTSKDNVIYSKPKLVLHGTKNGWDNNMYRASIVNINGEYRIYYSALNMIGRHGIGITISNHLADFVGM